MYSEKVMDHFQHPRNVGEIEDANGVGEVGNAKCGDIMKMTMRIEAMRNMLLHYAWNKDNGMLTRAEASIAKQFCSESANIVVDHALQILGGIGFCGSRVSRIYRDLRITRISGGTGEIQTVIAARQVLKKYR